MIEKLKKELGASWYALLEDEIKKEYFTRLLNLEERQTTPPRENLFLAFRTTPPEKIKVVLVGQDPYPTPGHAHGLAFSCPIIVTRSLINIYKEIESDLGGVMFKPKNGNLSVWAENGVFLLNRALSLNVANNANWQNFTYAVLEKIAQNPSPKVVLLWGKFAQKASSAFEGRQNILTLTAAHPSPLSARDGFFGCKHFSKTNDFLIKNGIEPIDWLKND